MADILPLVGMMSGGSLPSVAPAVAVNGFSRVGGGIVGHGKRKRAHGHLCASVCVDVRPCVCGRSVLLSVAVGLPWGGMMSGRRMLKAWPGCCPLPEKLYLCSVKQSRQYFIAALVAVAAVSFIVMVMRFFIHTTVTGFFAAVVFGASFFTAVQLGLPADDFSKRDVDNERNLD